MLISASRRSIFADSTSAGMIVLGCLKKEVMNPEQVRVSVYLEGILLQVVKSSAKKLHRIPAQYNSWYNRTCLYRTPLKTFFRKLDKSLNFIILKEMIQSKFARTTMQTNNILSPLVRGASPSRWIPAAVVVGSTESGRRWAWRLQHYGLL
jgi:hypothetical protein